MSDLHASIAKGDLEAVKLLLKTADIDVNMRDSTGALAFAPLHLAARRGDVKVLRTLLSDPRVDIEARDATKCTALRHAMGTGQLAAATELLVAGADAKNGLLPFIMLDGYNHLVAFLQKTVTDLEAQVLPHRAMIHQLKLLLLRYNRHHSAAASTYQQRQQQQSNEEQKDTQPAHRQSDQQKQQQPQGAVLKGVQRDSAELQALASTVRELRVELERVHQPISPAVCHAIVSLVKAYREVHLEGSAHDEGELFS